MGCFSYICNNCGESIKENEGVKLFVLQDGKVLEEMEGNYDLYGRVDDLKWTNDWSDICHLNFNRHRCDGIAAIHIDCWDGTVPTESSDDDEHQGCGKKGNSPVKKSSHKFYAKTVELPRDIEDDKKLRELGDRAAETMRKAQEFLDSLKNKKHV